jgi:hypothetical protein
VVSVKSTLVAFFTLATSVQAFAWGERGHDLISRVAARILIEEDKTSGQLSKPFAYREHFLGHLANVPDIVWRNGDKETTAANAPTHYLDMEYLSAKPELESYPKSVAEAAKAAQKLGKNLGTDVGTAPFRVGQLFRMMTDALKSLKGLDGHSSEANSAIDKALLAGGIMSHFVGDLAQPLHATKDYDGWDIGQGGIHSYFESEIVDSLPLSLDQEVFDAAKAGLELKQLFAGIPAKERAQYQNDATWLAIAIAVNSFKTLPELQKLDLDKAIVKKSITEPLKKPAERKTAIETRQFFKKMVASRLALGAEALAYLWKKAWEDAGKPDLSLYKSYAYPVAPEFIKPDYLPGT